MKNWLTGVRDRGSWPLTLAMWMCFLGMLFLVLVIVLAIVNGTHA